MNIQGLPPPKKKNITFHCYHRTGIYLQDLGNPQDCGLLCFCFPYKWVILVGNKFDGPFWDILAELLSSHGCVAPCFGGQDNGHDSSSLVVVLWADFFLKWPATFIKIVETAGKLVSSPRQKKLPSWIIMLWSIWLKTKRVWTRSTLQRPYQKGPSYPSLAIAGVAGVGRRVSFLDEWILGPLLAILGIKCSLTSLHLPGWWQLKCFLNVHPENWGKWSNFTTLRKTNIAMENGPFEDVLPIENGDFPLLC